jgi:hypothetical protein
MGDYHTTHRGPYASDSTTQWDDIQVKLGNKPAPEPAWKPEDWTPGDDGSGPKDKAWLDSKDEKELEEAEDDLDDDRFLEEYRHVPRSARTVPHSWLGRDLGVRDDRCRCSRCCVGMLAL